MLLINLHKRNLLSMLLQTRSKQLLHRAGLGVLTPSLGMAVFVSPQQKGSAAKGAINNAARFKWSGWRGLMQNTFCDSLTREWNPDCSRWMLHIKVWEGFARAVKRLGKPLIHLQLNFPVTLTEEKHHYSLFSSS